MMDTQSLMATWLQMLSHIKRYSPHTVEAYRLDLLSFFEFLQGHVGGEVTLEMLKGLRVADLRGWMAGRHQQGLAARSTARSVSVVRNFLKFLSRETGQDFPVMALLKAPRVKVGLPRPLSVEQAAQLVDEIETVALEGWVGLRDRALFIFLYATGMRISEALSLTRGCLPLGDRLVVTGKGSKQRIIPIIQEVREAVDLYVKACPFALGLETPLFVGVRGGALSASIAQRTLRQYRRAMGLPEHVTPHALRHSCATHLMAESGDLRGIQELLGHVSLTTTQVYTNIDQKQLMSVYDSAHPRERKKSR